MKFIIQDTRDDSYMVIDTTSCTSQNNITTLDEALATSLCNIMSNPKFQNIEDEGVILQRMKQYTVFKFIQFVLHDEPTSYEYW
jgi:predicted component of type VI protein secretion system